LSGIVKTNMNPINDIPRKRISTTAVSIAMIICSGIWQVSACVYYSTSGFGSDWSATPLLWMLAVMVTPAVCFAGGMILFEARKQSRFTVIEWWALAAILLPVTVGTLLSVWAVKVLFGMSGL
jgi:hypothetical protein